MPRGSGFSVGNLLRVMAVNIAAVLECLHLVRYMTQLFVNCGDHHDIFLIFIMCLLNQALKLSNLLGVKYRDA